MLVDAHISKARGTPMLCISDIQVVLWCVAGFRARKTTSIKNHCTCGGWCGLTAALKYLMVPALEAQVRDHTCNRQAEHADETLQQVTDLYTR